MPEASGLPSVQNSGAGGGGEGRGLGRASGRVPEGHHCCTAWGGLLEVSPRAGTAASDQRVTVAT